MMKKRVNKKIMTMVILCSTFLASCSAVSAQKITNNGSGQGMNGSFAGQRGMHNGTGFQGRSGNSGTPRMRGMMNADLIGKIVSVDSGSMKIEVYEQTRSNPNTTSNSTNKQQGASGNNTNANSNSNNQSRRGPQGNMFNMTDTGVEKTLTISSDVALSQQPSFRSGRNNNDTAQTSLKITDLKKGQMIMIWYKENTQTVDRINIVQS